MSENIKLIHPIEVNGTIVEEITLRRPKVRDIEKMDKYKNEMQKSVHLIADLAMISPDEVRELDAEDFTNISNCVGEFLDAGAA